MAEVSILHGIYITSALTIIGLFLIFVAGCVLIWLERHKLSNLDAPGGVGGGGFDGGSCDGGGGGH